MAVPTNVITGFLGVGKTSAILHLLKSKPENERWAILVNEFGEIGIDGSLFEGIHKENQGVFIKEVPGGCMCCTAGLPMQIALNQLLTKAKPHRLLIEPTGLGHPLEVLQVLTSEHYQTVLNLQKTITLVDARNLRNEKYTRHDTFNQQIAIADTIVGNKADLYSDGDEERLRAYVKQMAKPDSSVFFTRHGKLEPSDLEGPSLATQPKAQHHHNHAHAHAPSQTSSTLLNDQPFGPSGIIKAENSGEGFNSMGWRFSPDKVFDRYQLEPLLAALVAERMKAVFITQDGVLGYNLTTDALTVYELDDCIESRIELIAPEIDNTLETRLLACCIE